MENSSWPTYRSAVLLLSALAGVGLAITVGVILGWRSKREVTVAVTRQPEFGLIYIANDRGYFKKNGLVVTLHEFELGKDAVAEVIEGKADIGTGFETPIIHAIYQGKEVNIIGEISSSSRNVALAGRKDQGITSKDSLQGKVAALPVGTTVEYFLYQFLTGEGIPLANMTIRDTGSSISGAYLLADPKYKDIVGLWGLELARLQKEESGKIFFFTYPGYSELALVVIGSKPIPDQGRTYSDFMEAIIAAEKYYRANPIEAARIISRYIPGSTASEIQDYFNRYTMEVKLDNVLIKTLNRESIWFRDTGRYTGNTPNFRQHIKTGYLEAVDPMVVTLD